MKNSLKLYCPIRKTNVAGLPEEIVRQKLIKYLVDVLGYPLALISVEQELRRLPHLILTTDIPDRRADILCFARDIHPDFTLFPLLLIECKAVKMTSRVLNQVCGYNQYVKAFFVAAVNQETIKFGWFNSKEKKYHFIDHIPTYQQLLSKINIQKDNSL